MLYLLIGLSLPYVLSKGFDRRDVRIAAGMFLVQLVLNVLWSYLLFGWQMIGAATVEIVLLWVAAICVTMYLFYRIQPVMHIF